MEESVTQKEQKDKSSFFSEHTSVPISVPMLYSMKKSGLTNLLFNNEDRRDFCSYSYNKSQSNVFTVTTKKTTTGATFESVAQRNTTRVYLPSDRNAKEKVSLNTFAHDINKRDNRLASAPLESVSENIGQNIKERFEKNKNTILTLETWPDLWKNMHKHFALPLQENRNSQVRVAWTYAGLEQDALGVANRERQVIMKKILTALNHKKGTHSFIPYSLPHEDGESFLAIHEEATFFWSAMRLVKPRILLVYGSSARDALQIPKLRPLQKIDMGALRILQMHKPETLVQEPTHFAATLAFLQDSLRICASK